MAYDGPDVPVTLAEILAIEAQAAALDVDVLARARHATWPECYSTVPWNQCGAVNHLIDAEEVAREYRAILAETER
jgi:hypothetical protein